MRVREGRLAGLDSSSCFSDKLSNSFIDNAVERFKTGHSRSHGAKE